MSRTTETITYLKLAAVSRDKRQLSGGDRFLLLAAIAACRDGDLNTADRCRTLVLEHNPKHLVSQWTSIPDALRDEEFAPFVKQLEKFCHPERAETLVAGLVEEYSWLSDETQSAESLCERMQGIE